MKATIISGKTSKKLGVIDCHSEQEACLFLAINFPEHYFGANIIFENRKTMIATTNAHPESTTAIDAALKMFNSQIKIASGLCDVEEDEDGTVYMCYPEIKSENERFVKK